MALPQTDPLTNLIVLKWDPPHEGDPEKASNSLVLGKGKIKKNRKICVVLFLPYLNTMYLQVHETPPFFTRNITFHAVCVFI